MIALCRGGPSLQLLHREAGAGRVYEEPAATERFAARFVAFRQQNVDAHLRALSFPCFFGIVRQSEQQAELLPTNRLRNALHYSGTLRPNGILAIKEDQVLAPAVGGMFISKRCRDCRGRSPFTMDRPAGVKLLESPA